MDRIRRCVCDGWRRVVPADMGMARHCVMRVRHRGTRKMASLRIIVGVSRADERIKGDPRRCHAGRDRGG